MPSSSTAFLQALGSATGSASRTIVDARAPAGGWRPRSAPSRSRSAPACSTLPSVSSAAPSSSGGASVTALPSQASVRSGTLRRSMKRSTWPSLCSSAKPSANGVRGTSPPRTLSSQAIESGCGDQRHVGALGLDDAGDARALGVAALAGELVGMRQHRRQRRRRPVAPHGVDGIGIDRHEARRRRAGRRGRSARGRRRSCSQGSKPSLPPLGRFSAIQVSGDSSGIWCGAKASVSTWARTASV